MKTTFNLCLLFAGTLLTISPITYKIVSLIILALLINAGKGPVNLSAGEDVPFLILAMLSGLVMILISIISNFLTRNKI
jgi:hypothetical protein